MTGEERVQWLRTAIGTLGELRRISLEAEGIWDEVLEGADVHPPDPILDLGVLCAESDVVHFAEIALERIEAGQEALEARLRGEWRDAWGTRPQPDPVDDVAADYFRLKALDPEAAAIIGDAVIKAAKAGPGEAARAAVDESKERLAALDARRAAEGTAR